MRISDWSSDVCSSDLTTSGVIGITVDGSTDVLAGTAGNDAIVGDGSAQEIEDLAGNDIIIGGDGADTINLANDGDTDVLVYNALSEAGDVVTGFDTDADRKSTRLNSSH